MNMKIIHREILAGISDMRSKKILIHTIIMKNGNMHTIYDIKHGAIAPKGTPSMMDSEIGVMVL